MLAQIQAHPDGRWMFRLWLELLLQAGPRRGDARARRRVLAPNRELIAQASSSGARASGPRAAAARPTRLATALIAMDIGLAIQHYVDPDAVPLDVYPEIFGAVFDSR